MVFQTKKVTSTVHIQFDFFVTTIDRWNKHTSNTFFRLSSMIESILHLLQGIPSLVRNSDYVADANLPIIVVHFKRFMNNLEIFEDTFDFVFVNINEILNIFFSRNCHILCGKSHAFYYVSYFTQQRFTCNAFICSKIYCQTFSTSCRIFVHVPIRNFIRIVLHPTEVLF